VKIEALKNSRSLSLARRNENPKRPRSVAAHALSKMLILAKRPSFDLRNRIGTNRRNNRKLVTLLDGHMSHIEKKNERKLY
jgi:hypothetical protein